MERHTASSIDEVLSLAAQHLEMGPNVPSRMKNRTKRNQDLADWIVSEGIRRGIGQLTIEDTELSGRLIQLNGRTVINFGSASYLGLELDPRLADGTIDAVRRLGTQYCSSRAYVSSSQYPVIEELLEEVFGAYVIVTPTTTLGHLAAIPTLIQEGDVVLMDSDVHASVQMAVDVVKSRGVRVESVPHSDVSRLVEKVDAFKKSCDRIWFMIDGVYSMHGDIAPLQELVAIMEQYEQLHLYVDDAHGMSWFGTHGRGVTLETIGVHERIVVATSLCKAFGGSGGALVFPDAKLRTRVRNCGRPLIFSGPVQPPMLGADIASAKIHLSPEITQMQDELKQRIDHCNNAIKRHGLPVASISDTPIFFIKAGLPTVGGNLMKRLLDDGFYVNVGIYPAVKWQDTGMRFSVNRHQSMQDITNLIDAIAYHLPKAKKEETSTRALLRNIMAVTSKEEIVSLQVASESRSRASTSLAETP